jgi:hypothetical protein
MAPRSHLYQAKLDAIVQNPRQAARVGVIVTLWLLSYHAAVHGLLAGGPGHPASLLAGDEEQQVHPGCMRRWVRGPMPLV